MNTQHTNQSRAQFEAWASEHCCAARGISFKRFSDDGADSVYNDPNVETAWQAWQAASQQQTEPTEHGLYVILYRDNWDGEGDTSYILARLDPNGEWYAEESGAQLMTYEGDAILRAWPITEDTAMRPDPKPVLNCWCCSTLVTFKQRADVDGNCPHCGAEIDVDKDLAAQRQAEPVSQQLLALVKSFGHKTGCAKNAFGERCTCGVDEAIAAAEQAQQAEPVAYLKTAAGVMQLSFEGNPVVSVGSDIEVQADTVQPLYAQPPAQLVACEFFAYDPECGFETFKTEAEAKKYAQDSIDSYREEASEGWPELVNNVCWGVVLGTTREVALPDNYDGGNGLADYMKPVDYVLTTAQTLAVAVPDSTYERKRFAKWFCMQDALKKDDASMDGYWAGWLARSGQPPAVAVPDGYHLVADATLRRAIVSLIDRITGHALSCNETAVEQLRFINDIAAAPQAAVTTPNNAWVQCPNCGVSTDGISTAAPQGAQLSPALADIAAERRRQIEAEGWTPEHDDAHSDGQMATAAACYAISAHNVIRYKRITMPSWWPWDSKWWKPSTTRRDLVKAGALIAAEIERIDRAAQKGGAA